MKMFGFMMANLTLTINTDFETSRACFEALAQRTKDLNYEDVKILYFMATMLKFGPNWRQAYKQYSEEFDILNKNKINEEASVEVETEEEKK